MQRKSLALSLLCLLAVAGVLLGCMGRDLVRIDPKTESYVLEEMQVQEFVGVDVLVIVDNSRSMAAEQSMLRDAFPDLITTILNPPIDPDTGKRVHAPVRDLHIGVVSTDMGVGGYDVQTCDEPMVGDDGVLQHTPRGSSCAPSYPTFLSYSIGETEEPNIDMVTAMSNDFGCIAVLGTQGCGFEQQLEAGWKALMVHSQTGGANAGFLRPDTILTILFVTDEEDCSTQDTSLFDIASLPYSINLQCYYQKDKLYGIDRYFNDLSSLRSKAENLVLGFIVGVPPDDPLLPPVCEGRGDEIGGCLDTPPMQETVRVDGELLEYSCKYPADCTPPNPPTEPGNCNSEAFPAIRYVNLAKQFGDNAVVQSICTNSFEPAVAALTEKLQDAINAQRFRRQLQIEKDTEDASGCRCVATCDIIEELTDKRPCTELGNPAKTTLFDEFGAPAVSVDEDTGQEHTLCVIAQAGAILFDCSMSCDDALAVLTKDPSRAGWWYDPSEDIDGDTVNDPQVKFEDVQPESGSGVSIQCSSVVCPEGRQCGPSASPGAKCCNVNEFCSYPKLEDQNCNGILDPGEDMGEGNGILDPGEDRNGNEILDPGEDIGNDKIDYDITQPGLCLLRQDVCNEYGDDVWCAGINHSDPNLPPVGTHCNIGGVCCLDHNVDGKLDWVNEVVSLEGGRTACLPDYPSHFCAGGGCARRDGIPVDDCNR